MINRRHAFLNKEVPFHPAFPVVLGLDAATKSPLYKHVWVELITAATLRTLVMGVKWVRDSSRSGGLHFNPLISAIDYVER